MDHSDYEAIMLRLEPWVRSTVRDAADEAKAKADEEAAKFKKT